MTIHQIFNGILKALNSFSRHIAVREDRMPGGRNSGAVYNLYKVKYKKHKKANKAATTTSRASPPEKPKDPLPPLPPNLVNGTILKTALTNPSEVDIIFIMLYNLF